MELAAKGLYTFLLWLETGIVLAEACLRGLQHNLELFLHFAWISIALVYG